MVIFMGIPFESNSTYYTDSKNQALFEIVNPFSNMSLYAIQIIYPVLPTIDGTEYDENPTFEVSDFLVWAKAFKEHLEEEDSFLYPMFNGVKQIATSVIHYGLIRNEHQWRQLVSLYMAHYLEILITAMKDEGNHVSLNAYNKDKDNHLEMAIGNITFEEFKSTIYGRMFWHLYQSFGKFAFWGVTI